MTTAALEHMENHSDVSNILTHARFAAADRKSFERRRRAGLSFSEQQTLWFAYCSGGAWLGYGRLSPGTRMRGPYRVWRPYTFGEFCRAVMAGEV